jgi:hypothetical protein
MPRVSPPFVLLIKSVELNGSAVGRRFPRGI